MEKEGDNHFGWTFPTSKDEYPRVDSYKLNGSKTIREFYELSNSNYNEKYTI